MMYNIVALENSVIAHNKSVHVLHVQCRPYVLENCAVTYQQIRKIPTAPALLVESQVFGLLPARSIHVSCCPRRACCRHVILLERCRFWGDWDTEWSVRLRSLTSPPQLDDGGNSLVLRARQVSMRN